MTRPRTAFSPDDRWICYSSPENRITRHDLQTGQMLTRYEPALEPHSAVGIAVSPDGARVAAGHYHQTTPVFVHLRWSEEARTITLVSASTIGQFASGSGFPSRATSDILPRVYEWDWQKGELAVKSFTPQEKRPTLPVRASLPANRTRHLHQARSGV